LWNRTGRWYCLCIKLVESDGIKTPKKDNDNKTTFQTTKILCCIQTTKAAQQMTAAGAVCVEKYLHDCAVFDKHKVLIV